MKKKYIPYVIGIPNASVGLLWGMNLVLIPLLVGSVTKSNTQLGLLISMGAFTGIFVQYIAGLLSDRSTFKMGKRKPFILAGVFASAVFSCMMPFAKTYWLLFIITFLFYFSLNFFQGPYYSLIPETVEENQLGLANGFSKILSIIGSGFILFTGPMFFATSPKFPFFLAAAIGIISVLPAIFWIKEKPGQAKKAEKVTFDFFRFPSVMKLYATVFFVFLSYGCITPFFVKYCTTVLKFDQGTASNGLLLLTLAGAIFAYPIGVMSDKVERRKVLFYGTFLFGAALLAATFVSGVIGMYALLALIGIGFIAIQITIYPILSEIVPAERLGEFMGFMNLFISLGQFISNNVMGYVLDHLGFVWLFPSAGVIMLVASGLTYFSRFTRVAEIDTESRNITY